MRAIEVKDMPAEVGTNYYVSGLYPETGLYIAVGGCAAYYVDKGLNYVSMLTLPPGMVFDIAKPVQPDYLVNHVETPAGLSANDLLKAIAIVQRPELVKELLK